jgi:2-polyprenyl-6-methoxyphenol hydroxylase-like FAD-dependent oxidoreductase
MPELGEHAVVLGASMGGLLAARVLSEFYGTVTVVDRDALPDDPANRRGVPQGRHTHLLLPRGAQVIEELFPGILDELVADGVPVWGDGDLSKTYMSFGGFKMLGAGLLTIDERDMAMYLASRPFLECRVRRRLRTITNVSMLSGHDFVEFVMSSGRVTGIRVVQHDGGGERELRADLVVDALGRGAHTPAILESLGYGRPVEDHVVTRTTYVSQRLQIPRGTLKEVFADIGPGAGRPTGMFLARNENDSWIFTVFGMLGHEPPRDLAGMLSFASDYAPTHLLDAVRAGEPVGEVTQHRMPSSQWRRYDKMQRFPDGLLVTGDAICSFNPVYGQGMTVSALDAVALRDCLRRGRSDLARRYFRASAKPIGVAWQMAASADLAFPEVEGKRSRAMRVSNRLVDWVLGACESDPVVLGRFYKVNGLVDSPVRLAHPEFIYRVAAANLRRRRARKPQQTEAAARAV